MVVDSSTTSEIYAIVVIIHIIEMFDGIVFHRGLLFSFSRSRRGTDGFNDLFLPWFPLAFKFGTPVQDQGLTSVDEGCGIVSKLNSNHNQH